MDLYTFLTLVPAVVAEGLIYHEYFKYIQLKDLERENEIDKLTNIVDANNKTLALILEYDIPPVKLSLPLSNKRCEELKSKIKKGNKNEELIPLINKLLDYVPLKYLSNLLSNIETLEIERGKDLNSPILYRSLGQYVRDENKIYLYTKHADTLSHEFIHAASCFYDRENDGFSCGFSFNYNRSFSFDSNYFSFLNGLNEGYTEILNERIFNAKRIGYLYCYRICLLLELLFDDYKDMEGAYFSNDIGLLMETFLEYLTKEEFVYIIKKLDTFSRIPCERKELNMVVDLVSYIIQRTGDNNKIERCKDLMNGDAFKDKSLFGKRLVKKRD